MSGGGDENAAILMWGYLPGASPESQLPFLATPVPMPAAAGDRWRDVICGGRGFAVAISDSGKLFTWGETNSVGQQSYLTSGKWETPEVYPLPTKTHIVNAAAGWAHCVAVTAFGEVYTWGWKECVPTGSVIGGTSEKEEQHTGFSSDQGSPRSQVTRTSSTTVTNFEAIGGSGGEEHGRSYSTEEEYSISDEETILAPPCLVTLDPGVRIATVAAGGRHTLALSDVGQVWGWGYGGEGQLGFGYRVQYVRCPHHIPCTQSDTSGKDQPPPGKRAKKTLNKPAFKVTGSCVKAIACGGRHSAAVTDAGELLTFGWGLHGQCGQGTTDDELSPRCVSSLLGIKIQAIAAGLSHTICNSVDGDVYSFGGNQCGQLGVGAGQIESLPKPVESGLKDKNAKIISCGSLHSAILTDEGEVFCWGSNKYGQLGRGNAIDSNVPTVVPLENYRATSIACGWWHTLAIVDSVATNTNSNTEK